MAIESYQLYIGMALAGIFTGIGSAIGNYIGNKHIIEKVKELKEEVSKGFKG